MTVIRCYIFGLENDIEYVYPLRKCKLDSGNCVSSFWPMHIRPQIENKILKRFFANFLI